MLRASIEYQGRRGDLRAVTEGSKSADSGVRHGDELIAFVEAALGESEAELATARDALRAAAGSEALVDAAAVVGNFQRMVRIADGAGIELDKPMVVLSQDFREEIGLDGFRTADRAAATGALGRVLGPVASKAALVALRLFGRRARRNA